MEKTNFSCPRFCVRRMVAFVMLGAMMLLESCYACTLIACSDETVFVNLTDLSGNHR